MPRGGPRPNAGRKPGAAAKKVREAADRLSAEGLTPLDYMIGVLRGDMEFDPVKMDAARSAAPYIHPRLTAVEAKVETTINDLSDAELDRQIAALAKAAQVVAH
jgi:hypothetical protein